MIKYIPMQTGNQRLLLGRQFDKCSQNGKINWPMLWLCDDKESYFIPANQTV